MGAVGRLADKQEAPIADDMEQRPIVLDHSGHRPR